MAAGELDDAEEEGQGETEVSVGLLLRALSSDIGIGSGA